MDTCSGWSPKPAAPIDTLASAARARAIVMDAERRLGFEPTDREAEKLGYDIESRDPRTGKLRFIEVKGRDAWTPALLDERQRRRAQRVVHGWRSDFA